MQRDLKDTLNLPQTGFPMRADLVSREPKRFEEWEHSGLYARLQQKNAKGPRFLLHDGPPFTNGDIHIGTALNKVLKDIVVRYKNLRGYRAPFVPGWDCHGLPIEYKVSQALQQEGQMLDAVGLRQRCAEFSKNFMERQREQVKRIGILADWRQEYRTLDPAYEADVLRTFAAFVRKGLVYRGKKPVYWSIPCSTALAEAEVEYKPHKSPSVWVGFPLPLGQRGPLQTSLPLEVVIWTTTPWTLPANLALAVHPQLLYSVVQYGNKGYLMAQERISAVAQALGWQEGSFQEVETHTGAALEGLSARHPFMERASPLVLADYVTVEAGSGCVHTAPGHGLEDYHTGLKYGLECYSPLDDHCAYQLDAWMPAELVGVRVWDAAQGQSPANQAVLALLGRRGHLLAQSTVEHSYPHCWRSKAPVIFRAMDQWFIRMDAHGFRQEVLEAMKGVEWVPAWGESRMRGFLQGRPDWCISRQRSWGVPIPVFYDAKKVPYLDADVIEQWADRVQQHGCDPWFERSASELLAGFQLPPHWQGAELVPGRDTLDVWMESGASHQAVLARKADLGWPADLYLEGSDQHRGWFQSALWTAMATHGAPPYKAVVTHGFVTGEGGRKISKSEGKPQTAQSYIDQFGADILRLWVASEDYRDEVPFSENILQHVAHGYRTLRNTLRFQLGNLYDFDPQQHACGVLDDLDQWALAQTAQMLEAVTEAYDHYAFHKAYQLINTFCVGTLSAIYHDVLKDRLYTLAPQDPLRRSSQTALNMIFHVLVKVLAPILVFTADEAFGELRACQARLQGVEVAPEDSVHLQDWPHLDPRLWDAKVVAQVSQIFKLRSLVHEQLEQARQVKKMGQSLDACVIFSGQGEDFELFLSYQHRLPEFLIVSQVKFHHNEGSGNGPELAVSVEPAAGVRCPRSWRWVPNLVETSAWGPVSERCQAALRQKYS